MLASSVDDLRLIWAMGLTAAVFAGAYLFARRWTASRSQAACDAFLGLFAIEYVSVCGPGALHMLYPATMSAVAAALAIALLITAWIQKRTEAPRNESAKKGDREWSLAIAAAGPAFVGGYLACLFCTDWDPTVATDPLVYHLPTAVWWLQSHSLAIYPTWYWNPAASYCPLSGSAFIAWLIAPMGNDVLARFVQFPALLFIFCLVARFCRLAGCSRAVSAWVAVASVMARPFFSETLFPKDDLFVAAFVGAAVLSAASENMRDRLGPWRAGVALGMVLASKYTVLLVCPVLLFLIDAPWRARWRGRQYLAAISAALLLGGGWYVRNAIGFGDPLFPVDVRLLGQRIFTGLFGAQRDVQLQSAGGIRRMIGDAYYSWPGLVRGLLAVAWAAALLHVARIGSAFRDPLGRACLLGAPVTLGIFVLISPHHEVRYLSPLLLLFFASAGVAIGGWLKQSRPAGVAAAVLAAGSIATSFAWSAEVATLPTIAISLALAVVVGAIAWTKPRPRHLLGGAAVATAILLAAMYVFWDAHVQMYEQLRIPVLGQYYPDFAEAWKQVDQLPPGATVAYANTYFVYPLYGFHLQRRVVYAPVRRGVGDFAHLPRLGDAVPGDQIVQTMTRVMDADADRRTWYANLKDSKAQYLLVVKDGSAEGLDAHPPEFKWARADRRHFQPVFEDGNAVLYRIRSDEQVIEHQGEGGFGR